MIASANKIFILRCFLNILKKSLYFVASLVFNLSKKDPYEIFISEAFYAPWKVNINFLNFYENIKNLTMLDYVRLYTIWDNIDNIKDVEGDLIEVGSWKGGVSMMMGKKLLLDKSKKKVFSYDTFHGVVKSSKLDPFYNDNEHNEADLNKFQEYLNKFKLKNVKIVSGIYPDNFLKDIDSKTKYCLAHIDVDTYKSAYDSFKFIWARMPTNGIFIFDDYGFHQTNGIRLCVDNIRKNYNVTFLFLTCGQAVLIKK